MSALFPARTEEQDQQIITLWNRGASASVIGEEVGSSRSAILGRILRLRKKGIPLRATTRINGSRDYKPRSKRTSGLKPAGPVHRHVVLPPAEPLSLEGRPTLAELRRNRCKYAIGERDSMHVFCGEPAPTGPWCAGHHSVVFRGISR
jgi:hypothetical protein